MVLVFSARVFSMSYNATIQTYSLKYYCLRKIQLLKTIVLDVLYKLRFQTWREGISLSKLTQAVNICTPALVLFSKYKGNWPVLMAVSNVTLIDKTV